MSYKNIIVAISETFESQHLAGDAIASSDNVDIAAQIMACQQKMPDYLRLPVRLLTWLFDLTGLMHGGSRFQKLANTRKLAQIEAWRHSPLGVCRNFIRFYESLFLLIALQEDCR